MDLMRRSAVTVVGVALVLLGIVLMPLPGPGILVVVSGLAVLATEYVWARRMLRRAQREAEKAQEETVASPLRIVMTVASALTICAVGVAMLVIEDVPWPFWDTLLDSLWGPVAGGTVVVTSIIALVITAVSVRKAPGDGGRRPRSACAPRRPVPGRD